MNNNWQILLFFMLMFFIIGSYGCNHQKILDNRDSMVNFFRKNEAEIKELVNFFEKIKPKDNKYLVSFGLSSKNKINLHVFKNYGNIADNTGRIFFNNVRVDAKKLDSVLTNLNWTTNELSDFKLLLEKSECNWIRSTGFYGDPIEIQIYSKLPNKFSFYIFQDKSKKDLNEIHGPPLGNIGFLNSVYVVSNLGGNM